VTGDQGNDRTELLCARCVRAARDADDFATWTSFDDGDEICPGCLTLAETAARRGGDGGG
jgi:hypothetical protein